MSSAPTVQEASGPAFTPLADDALILQPILALVADEPRRIVASVRESGRFVDITVGDLYAQTQAIAKGLVASGVEAGDRVALMCSTRLEWLLVDLSAQVADGTPERREVLAIDEGGLDELQRRGTEVPTHVVDERIADLRADHLATIIYTSGTTGRPKGCAHSLTKGYVLFGLEHGMKAAFATDIAHLLEELPMVKPTIIAAVPRIFEKVYEGARQKAKREGKGRIFDLAADVAIRWSVEQTAGKVRPTTKALHWLFDKLVYGKIRHAFGGRLRFAISGGGPLGERLTHFYAGIGLVVYGGYGLTETSPTLTINSPSSWKPGTVGRPLAGTTIRIAPDGEILAKGPQVFSGCWHAEAATAIVVGEGQPFVSALVTLDEEALRAWADEHGHAQTPLTELTALPELRAEAAGTSVRPGEPGRACVSIDLTRRLRSARRGDGRSPRPA
jgi:long-chain acyl-CoA synthetase